MFDPSSGYTIKQCGRYSMEGNLGAKIVSDAYWLVYLPSFKGYNRIILLFWIDVIWSKRIFNKCMYNPLREVYIAGKII